MREGVGGEPSRKGGQMEKSRTKAFSSCLLAQSGKVRRGSHSVAPSCKSLAARFSGSAGA